MTERIINRIKKMLALANDLAASDGERDNALRMAYATMAKHNIDMAQVDGHEATEPRIDFDSQSFNWQWARSINYTIGKLFFCFYYTGRKINGTQSMHHFIGKESNAMTAAVMADWIVKSTLKEARSMYKDNTCPETRSFALGVAAQLALRVKAIREEEAAKQESGTPGTSLVLASLYLTEERANDDFINAGNYRFKNSVRRNTSVNSDAYSRGQDFGSKINLSSQLGANNGSAKALK